MTYIVTATFDVDAATLAEAEKRNPETIGAILEIAKDYFLGHTRYTRDGAAFDLDVYRSEAEYQEFIAKAGPLIARYAADAGATVQDVGWQPAD